MTVYKTTSVFTCNVTFSIKLPFTKHQTFLSQHFLNYSLTIFIYHARRIDLEICRFVESYGTMIHTFQYRVESIILQNATKIKAKGLCDDAYFHSSCNMLPRYREFFSILSLFYSLVLL